MHSFFNVTKDTKVQSTKDTKGNVTKDIEPREVALAARSITPTDSHLLDIAFTSSGTTCSMLWPAFATGTAGEDTEDAADTEDTKEQFSRAKR
jgi:hypothetical protein